MIVRKRIFALGFFDGVHLGHQALLRQCVEMAQEQGAAPTAITFSAHPQSLFDHAPGLINTNEDRQRLLRSYGMEEILIFPVTKEVMSTSWEEFLHTLLAQGAVGFVCGKDFRFGHRGAGNAGVLQEYCRSRNLPCSIVPDQTIDGMRVSSSHIRALISAGDMENASLFLGHPHILSGKVIAGKGLGHTIGIPTANLRLPEELVQPASGVYACTVLIDGRTHVAVTNIGTRPTVDGHGIRAESWILDFNGDLYGKDITLQFHKFLRPEQKFADLNALKAQIQKDAAETYKLYK